MSEQEKEAIRREDEGEDVEAHAPKRHADDAEPPEGAGTRGGNPDDPDVEAHAPKR
jgi:hypothetical protein